MKKLLFTIMTIGVIAFSKEAKSQCNYVPTVYPENLIMCPGAKDTLWTQVYDTYQWYKEDTLIPGATNRYLVVDQYWDAAYRFKVVTTLNGCKDTSASVMVDGWVFQLPFVIHDGDQGRVDMNGITHLCKGDTLIFRINPFPYDTNIVWYKDGSPIPGEDGFELKVTETGWYTMSGSPSICPDFVAHLGLEIGVIVHEPLIPTINATGNLLSASNAITYQWYLDGNIIPNAVQQSYRATKSGAYTVSVTDTNFCYAESDKFNFVLSGIGSEKLNQFAFYPNPTSNLINIDLPNLEEVYTLEIKDLQGKLIKRFEISKELRTVNVEELSQGVYLLELKGKEEIFSNKLSIVK